MGTSQIPKGLKVRIGPDWDQAGTFIGSGQSIAAAMQFPVVSLYNSGSASHVCNVYGFTATQAAAGEFLTVGTFKGSIGSVVAGAAFPILPGQQPSENGDIYQGTLVPVTKHFVQGISFGMNGRADFEFFQPFPLAVITPGFSFCVLSNQAAITLTCGFFWTETPWPVDSPPVMSFRRF